MTICFVRHGALESPYDLYSNLSLTQLDALATQRVDPSIDQEKTYVTSRLSRTVRESDSLNIYCATSRRARQTGSSILMQAGVGAKKVSTKLLNEISFEPSKLVTKTEYNEFGMAMIRSRLFEAILKDSVFSEGIESIYSRIKKLDQLLGNADAKCVVCVTHGFLMRFLELYFKEGVTDSFQVTIKLIEQQPNRPNLRGFRINR